MPSPFRIARWVRRGVIGRPRSGRIGRVAARFFLNPAAFGSAPKDKALERIDEERDRIEHEAYENQEGM